MLAGSICRGVSMLRLEHCAQKLARPAALPASLLGTLGRMCVPPDAEANDRVDSAGSRTSYSNAFFTRI